MALKKSEFFKKIKEFNDTPLTEDELEVISKVEDIIDNEISEQIGKNEKIIYIELGYPNFNYIIEGVEIKNTMRLNKMRDEIDKRYKKAGWKIRVEYDDGLDGPNMSGPDYWILY
jgi:hypothetical protein